MKASRKLSRRSFVASVIGGTVASGGALGIIGGSPARAQTGPYTGVTDNDSGSYADNAGHGRGPGGNAYGQPQGITDTDAGDPEGGGRGGATGYSDSDTGQGADRSGHGRRGRVTETGITDDDPVDPSRRGRGASQRVRPDVNGRAFTGVTDTDLGAGRDPYNYGRGSRSCRDSDAATHGQVNGDPARRCE